VKVLDVALKDMRQSFRSYIALAFMFGIPILITAMFFFMFGGLRDEDEAGFTLPKTSVLIVNLDSGGFETLGEFGANMPEGFGGSDFDLGSGSPLGEMVLQVMGNEDFEDILEVSVGEDQTRARMAVENQEVDLAIHAHPTLSEAVAEAALDSMGRVIHS